MKTHVYQDGGTRPQPGRSVPVPTKPKPKPAK